MEEANTMKEFLKPVMVRTFSGSLFAISLHHLYTTLLHNVTEWVAVDLRKKDFSLLKPERVEISLQPYQEACLPLCTGWCVTIICSACNK